MKILMIAYYFPPDSSSGSFRPLIFARHLQEMGENVSVLTAREQDYLPEQSRDHKLLEEIHDDTEIFRSRVFRPREAVLKFRDFLFRKTDAQGNSDNSTIPNVAGEVPSKTSFLQQLKDSITDTLSTPDEHIGWLPSAVGKGLKVIKDRNIDIVYATGRPWTSLLIGVILKKLTGRPLIVDFRDPWVANPSNFMLKSKFIRALESFMESKVITFADHIVVNTPELKQSFLDRYESLSVKKFTAIPNGFEEYLDLPKNNNKRLTFTHAGALYFSRTPRFLLQAAINVIKKNIIPKEELSLVFLGGIDISIQDPDLVKLLKHPILPDVVKILPRLPYREAVKYQSKSDILFLIQPDFPLQVPRKLYEYMAFRKPILGITDSDGATARVIRENKLGIVVENQTSAIEAALTTFYEQWKHGVLYPSSTDTYDQFINKNLTRQLQKIFREVTL